MSSHEGGPDSGSAEMEAIHSRLDAEAPDDYRRVAAFLANEWRERPPRLIGLGGGQGAGKSTLSALIAQAFELCDLRCCVLAIDDFYLERSARLELAERVHPLFETRGPPGTHDIALLEQCLEALRGAGSVDLPVFDKGLDDRSGWRRVECGEDGFDVVLLEGWCVGAPPVSERELVEPVNELEALRDGHGEWRRSSNDALAGSYGALFRRIDALAFLRVPGLDSVRRWRLEQEREREPSQRMSPEQVDAFVQHYERITLSMLRDVPPRAAVVVDLDEDHRVADVLLRTDASA